MRVVVGIGLGLLAVSPLHAEESALGNPLEDRVRLSAGWWRAGTSTDIRLDAANGILGTPISAEEDLGLRDSSDMADADIELRVRERHKLRFGYFGLNRKARATLERQVRFGDDLYLISDQVDSQLDISSFNVTYSYSFLRRERYELGASLGLQMLQFDARARVFARNLEEEESQTGPVPAPGLHATVRFSERFHAEARAEYLRAHIDDFEGKFMTAKAALWYRFTPNLAAGVGYALLEAEVISNETGDAGEFNFRNDGAELLFRASF